MNTPPKPETNGVDTWLLARLTERAFAELPQRPASNDEPQGEPRGVANRPASERVQVWLERA